MYRYSTTSLHASSTRLEDHRQERALPHVRLDTQENGYTESNWNTGTQEVSTRMVHVIRRELVCCDLNSLRDISDSCYAVHFGRPTAAQSEASTRDLQGHVSICSPIAMIGADPTDPWLLDCDALCHISQGHHRCPARCISTQSTLAGRVSAFQYSNSVTDS